MLQNYKNIISSKILKRQPFVGEKWQTSNKHTSASFFFLKRIKKSTLQPKSLLRYSSTQVTGTKTKLLRVREAAGRAGMCSARVASRSAPWSNIDSH